MLLDRKVPAPRAKVGAARRYSARIEGSPVDMWKSRHGRFLQCNIGAATFPHAHRAPPPSTMSRSVNKKSH